MASVTDPINASRARSGSITAIIPEINPIKSQIVQLIADIHDAEQRFNNQIPKNHYATLIDRMTPLMLQSDPSLEDSQSLLLQSMNAISGHIKEEAAPTDQVSPSAPEQMAEKPNHCVRDTALIVAAFAVVAGVVACPSCHIQ